MTSDGSTEAVTGREISASWRRFGRVLLLVGTPVLLGAALWFHPHGGPDVYESLEPVADRWLLVHVLLLPLFALLGICLHVLLREYDGLVATIGQVGTAVYLACYLAFEAMAGIATGVLVREARTIPPEQQEGVASVVQVLFTEPIAGVTQLLALIGTAGIVVAVTALAVLLRRSGAPLVPVLLLAGVPVTVVAHGGGGADVVGTAAFFVSVVWLEFGWRRPDDRPSAQAT